MNTSTKRCQICCSFSEKTQQNKNSHGSWDDKLLVWNEVSFQLCMLETVSLFVAVSNTISFLCILHFLTSTYSYSTGWRSFCTWNGMRTNNLWTSYTHHVMSPHRIKDRPTDALTWTWKALSRWPCHLSSSQDVDVKVVNWLRTVLPIINHCRGQTHGQKWLCQ